MEEQKNMDEHATKTYIDLTIATSIGKTPMTKFRNTNTNGTYTNKKRNVWPRQRS